MYRVFGSLAVCPSKVNTVFCEYGRVPQNYLDPTYKGSVMFFLKDIDNLIDKLDGRVSYIITSADGSLDLRYAEKEKFPSASIIKLPILWSVFTKVAKGEMALTDEMPVHTENIVIGYGILRSLHVGITPTVEDMCLLMTALSDNVATNMLIDRLGFTSINADISACGMSNTVLARKMEDAEARTQGRDNFTSSHDVITLLKLFRNSEFLSEPLRNRILNILGNQRYNNLISHYMPSGFHFAHKTGDIPGTLHDVGILHSPAGKEYYIAVMCSDLADNIQGLKFLNDFGVRIFAELQN